MSLKEGAINNFIRTKGVNLDCLGKPKHMGAWLNETDAQFPLTIQLGLFKYVHSCTEVSDLEMHENKSFLKASLEYV